MPNLRIFGSPDPSRCWNSQTRALAGWRTCPRSKRSRNDCAHWRRVRVRMKTCVCALAGGGSRVAAEAIDGSLREGAQPKMVLMFSGSKSAECMSSSDPVPRQHCRLGSDERRSTAQSGQIRYWRKASLTRWAAQQLKTAMPHLTPPQKNLIAASKQSESAQGRLKY
jgi:hypothetical protein